MGMWAIVRFLHVAAAATWLGMQVALFLLVPALRRMLPPERVREVVRAAGMRLAIVAGIALPTLAVTGIALGRHEESAAEHPGVVHLKQAVLVALIAILAGHGMVPGRRARIAASVVMLVLTVAAVYAGTWLTAAG
jgi:putative copper export protein